MEKLVGRRPASASAVTSVATNQELIELLQQKVKETDLTEKAGSIRTRCDRIQELP